MKMPRGLSALAMPIFSVVILLIIWQAYVWYMGLSPFILPGPLRIAKSADNFGYLALLGNAWTTIYEILIGFAVGNFLATIIAYAIVQSPLAERLIYPFLVLSQTVPKLAVAPLLVIWFGTGITPKIIIIILMCFFPTAINVVQGLRSTDPNAADLVRLVTASPRVQFIKVQFPSAIPYFFAGLKISVTSAVIGAIVGEWVGAESGLGYLILYGGQTMRTDLMFVAIAATVALGLCLYGAVALAEKLLSWKSAEIEARAS